METNSKLRIKLKIAFLLVRLGRPFARIFLKSYNEGYKRTEREIKRLKPKTNLALHILDPDEAYLPEYFQADHFSKEDLWADMISEKINEVIKPKSVVDFGCGRGLFLRYFYNLGHACLGYEGSQHTFSTMVIPKKLVAKTDLRFPIQQPKKKFSLAISLEVAEHIEREFAGVYAYNLSTHADTLVFSSIPPGILDAHPHHPNEQSPEYWDDLFAFFNFKEDKRLTQKLHKKLRSLKLPLNLQHYTLMKVYRK